LTARTEPAKTMRLAGIEGRRTAVTGASSGIGRAVAETFEALGASVAGIDLAAADTSWLSVAADVTDERAVDAAFTTIERELAGPVEVLVTCAGVFTPTPIGELTAADWRRTIEINLTGTFICAARALRSMREAGFGRIVTISSGAGIDGGTEACAHYAASKGGVIALTKAISKEVAREGVNVNCVAPRTIRTPMIAGLEDDLLPEIPVGRLGEPDDVAGAVAFLCSPDAEMIRGHVLVVDGGFSLVV